jgi:hypothetical protein
MVFRTLFFVVVCASCAARGTEVAPKPAAATNSVVQGAAVPEAAPRGWLIPADSVAKLYTYTNAVWTHPRSSGPYPRNIIMVFFVPAATREDRQSSIGMVDGQIIGGGGVFYYVLVPTATGDALWASIDRLAALPHVQLAGPDVLTWGITTFD